MSAKIPSCYLLPNHVKNQEKEDKNEVFNTYHMWNSKDKHVKMTNESNNIYFNLTTIEQINNYNSKPSNISKGKTLDSFSLYIGYNPSHNFDINEPIEELKDIETYNNTDIAEILRSDMSRLFFDIDVDEGDYDVDEFSLTFEQISNILKNLNIPINNLHGFVEGNNKEALALIPNEFNNQFVYLNNPYNTKDFSAHIYISDYYFNRDDLFNVFSQGLNRFNRNPNSVIHLAKYIDLSVYVRAGSQKCFRFGLSGKMNKNRPCPIFNEDTLNYVINNLNNYVCNKTSLDNNFIANTSIEYNQLKTYLSQFRTINIAKDNQNIKLKGTKKEIHEMMMEEINDNKECNIYIAKKSVHAQWYHSLIQEMKRYLISHKEATNEELFNVFSDEKYQYFSNSRNQKIYQPSSIRAAIEVVRENPIISIDEIFIEHFEEYTPKDEPQKADDVIKYTLEYFIKQVSKVSEYQIIADLIHYTFIFFTRKDKLKMSSTYIAFKEYNKETEQNKIICILYDNFLKSLETSPIYIKVLFNSGKMLKIDIKTAFSMFDKYKTKLYDFNVYSNKSYILSLFKPAFEIEDDIKAELPEEINEIFKIIATEHDQTINQDKIKYITEWFAYIVQHPESRNATALQISTVQGIGKNILSNALCTYLGDDFCLSNANINNIIGTYNGGMDNKLFVVINEVDTKEKEADCLKSVITDSTINVNVKYGGNYTTDNTASYLLFTNHIDTKTISNGDRRFTYIRSYGTPKPKKFYEDICIKGTDSKLKMNILKPFIKYLLNYDLSNYNPTKCEEFDKYMIYDQRQSSRSVLYNVLMTLLKEGEKNYVLVSEFIDLINKVIKGDLYKENDDGVKQKVSFGKYMDLEALNEYENDIVEEFENKRITAKLLSNIIKFEDDTEIEKVKSNKRDETRNKYIIRLRNLK